MKNLVSVIAAVLAVSVSASAEDLITSVDLPIEFCLPKDNAEQSIQALPALQMIMIVEGATMGAAGKKSSEGENQVSFEGNWGGLVMTQQGPALSGAKEAQITVTLDEDGKEVQSLVLSNNKNVASAYEAVVSELVKDEESQGKLKAAGQEAQCYKGSMKFTRGLAI